LVGTSALISANGISLTCLRNKHIKETYTGVAAEALNELKAAMMEGNHNNSDIQTDYFDVGWYISIDIGKWDKPYVLEK